MKVKISVLTVLAALILPLATYSATFKTGENLGIESQDVIRDDLYISGESILIAGSVTGDVFGAGRSVVVNAPVGGDIFAAGNSVSITSNVADDVRVVGGTVIVQGAVGDDVLAGGGEVSIIGRVQGDVIAGGQSVRIESSVVGSVRVAGEDVYINGPIVGSVEVHSEKLTLGPNAVLSSSLTYSSPREVILEEGALVKGEIKYEPRAESSGKTKVLGTLLLIWLISKTLALLLLALILGLLFRRFSIATVNAVTNAPWQELGRGLVVFVALPIISVICLATLVGIPLGLLGFLSFVALLVVGCGFAPILMGSIAHKLIRKGGYSISWKIIVVGVAIYSVLPAIPVVGSITNALFVLASIGAIAALKWRTLKEWR